MLIQIKRCIYSWKWETMGSEKQYMNIRSPSERGKTDILGRNTLSQLHWLHHSVNTQYRQDLIANIWWVWIYKNQTKVPSAPTPSYLPLCTLYDGALSQISPSTLSDPVEDEYG